MQSDQDNSHRDNCRADNNRKLQSGNLILVGMMGCGKTTMGRALDKHLGNAFVDSDEEIIKRTGVTIPCHEGQTRLIYMDPHKFYAQTSAGSGIKLAAKQLQTPREPA